MKNEKIIGYSIFRITMGLNFLFHGINRYYYGAEGFQEWMIDSFSETFFPSSLVGMFATVLPVLETITGISMIIGLKTKIGYYLGAIIIASLVVGSCMINKWDWVAFQMVYAICFYVLILQSEFNQFSIDRLIKS